MGDRNAQGGERDGGSCAEEAGETLGAKHFRQDREEADDDAADQEACEKLSNFNVHGNQPSCGSLRLLDHAHGGGDFLAAEERVFLSFKTVVVDKKFFQFAKKSFGQV